uniref:Uncharacterized protein n=1 Tax=Oryza punctata TaxID=4537 RepID=A0A0E0MPY2_ORYPU
MPSFLRFSCEREQRGIKRGRRISGHGGADRPAAKLLPVLWCCVAAVIVVFPAVGACLAEKEWMGVKQQRRGLSFDLGDGSSADQMETVWAGDGGQATTSTDLAVRTLHCSGWCSTSQGNIVLGTGAIAVTRASINGRGSRQLPGSF